LAFLTSSDENPSMKLPTTKPRIPPIGPPKEKPNVAPNHFVKFAMYSFFKDAKIVFF
jgi:hypothetical protein